MSGPLRIVASQNLGSPGTVTSEPVVCPWQWYYHFPSLALWGGILSLLVVPKANRDRRAWLILGPLLLVILLWPMSATLLSLPPSVAEGFGFVVVTGALAWSAVWLLGDWLARRQRFVAFLAALGVILALGALSYGCQFGFEPGEDLVLLAAYGCSGLFLLLAMLRSRGSGRGEYRPGAFLGRLLAALGLLPVVAILVWIGAMAIASDAPRDASLLSPDAIRAVIMIAAVALGWAILIYLFNLPFMLLAFNSPFYRERFQKLFRLSTGALE
jgi:hypothetical protein